MKHKHCDVIVAWAHGAEIEIRSHSKEWTGTPHPWWSHDSEYRVKPVPHKWQKEMDAQAAGKTIQVKFYHDKWEDLPNARFDASFAEYRIKPEPKRETITTYMYGSPIKLTLEDGKMVSCEVVTE